ncbi:uncharacterized protein ColSpa_06060 [Colletotrichum spaethianum]|uniref:Uncharacterized protein n=1 Tax=Colletotrichum spaethianum TaxID=700344 RepID=A0AA37LEE2_9PEZI|nr:uncharacterized protein ColSpa_06060 [Colletotrichum spaethianum]GKT45879.1 hypothetical protein ColSpa_06060 [Colletotrichum spaethianum]
MRFSILAAAGLIGAATAAPTSSPPALNWDDVVVVLNDGSTQIMKAAQYDAIESRAPESITRRDDCKTSTEAQILSDEEFLAPDVAISPVVSSNGAIPDISVANGYQVSNTVTVSVGVDLTVIEKVLSYSLSVSYAQSWTTTETNTLRFTMGAGQYGLVVSQPSVRRVTGNMLTGCTDKWDSKPFTSDTYTSQSYGNLAWVKGVIRLCNSTTYPFPTASARVSTDKWLHPMAARQITEHLEAEARELFWQLYEGTVARQPNRDVWNA